MCCGKQRRNGKPKVGCGPTTAGHSGMAKRKIDLHGERHHRGAVAPGHGAQGGITVKDKHTQTRGHEELECVK